MLLFRLAFVLLLMGATAMATGLSAKATGFLKEIGIKPASKEVSIVLSEQVGVYSLEALADKRDEDGVRAFIATRNFIRKYRQNTATPQPSVDLYQIRYLTDEEKAFITAQLKKSQ